MTPTYTVASTTPWQITYGSGSAAGVLCADSVAVAGMLLSNHAFGVTTQVRLVVRAASDIGLTTSLHCLIRSLASSPARMSRLTASSALPFPWVDNVALMLAQTSAKHPSLQSLSNQKVLTIPESLVKTGLMMTPIMSYALGRTADGVNDGELTIGGTNKALADAATSQVLPVTSATGFWDTAMASVQVDGQVAVTNRVAILDTGPWWGEGLISMQKLIGLGDPQAPVSFLALKLTPTSCMRSSRAHRRERSSGTALQPGLTRVHSDGQGTYTVPCTTNSIVTLTFGNVNYA